MRRTAIRRKPRTDQVSPELRAAVIERDHKAKHYAALALNLKPGKGIYHPICIAPIVDPTQWGLCFGRPRIEHVKREPRMGQRASILVDGERRADASVLVTLCSGHTEDGMKAGYVWATDAVNRQKCRDYLAARGAG